jgi:formylglycine-generating enzyme required for sulfatase activity
MKKIIFLASILLVGLQLKAQLTLADFILVEGGSFSMGNASYTREAPVRTVTLSAFYMSKKTITNSQFAAFLNEYGSTTVRDGEFAGKQLFVADSWGIVAENNGWKAAAGYEQYPAVKITWFGANEFCKYNNGRLPTEAEWEYAAKGGINKNAYTYSGSSTATAVAWYYDNSGQTNKAVGTKTANALGLFDMSGNVYQWCSDWFGLYNDLDMTAAGSETGVSKVIRGGYRSNGVTDLHLTHRESISPDECYNFVGFRMVKDNLAAGEKNVSTSICIFPNPASRYIQINSTEKILNISIIDCQGRKVYENTVNNDNTHTILTSKLSNGMYFVNVNTATIKTLEKIVIRN